MFSSFPSKRSIALVEAVIVIIIAAALITQGKAQLQKAKKNQFGLPGQNK